MKLEVTFFDNSQITFPEVDRETITIDNGLMAFVFRNGHTGTLILRSIKFIEGMPDDVVTEQPETPSMTDLATPFPADMMKAFANSIAENSTPIIEKEE